MDEKEEKEEKFVKSFDINNKPQNKARFERENEIYDRIEKRLEFLSNENNIIEEINEKKYILAKGNESSDSDNGKLKSKEIKKAANENVELDEEKVKEYKELFCSKEGFKYILKRYENNQKESKIILERAVCDLSKFATKFHAHFTFPQIRYIMYQILQGLIKLHNLSYDVNIFHNDLKAENIFVIIKNKDMKNELENILKSNNLEGIPNINEFLQKLLKECTFKIGDFDLSHIITGEFKNIDFIPGPIEDIIDVDKEDCYELGCILYYLRTGRYFQKYEKENKTLFQNPFFDENIKLTSNYLKLLNKMLQVDKNFRLNCYDILSMDFFKIDNIKNVDLLNTKMEDDEKFINFNRDIYDCYLDKNEKTRFFLPIEDRGTFKLKSEIKPYKKENMKGDFFILKNN